MFKKVGCFLSLKPLMNRCREKSFMVLKQLRPTMAFENLKVLKRWDTTVSSPFIQVAFLRWYWICCDYQYPFPIFFLLLWLMLLSIIWLCFANVEQLIPKILFLWEILIQIILGFLILVSSAFLEIYVLGLSKMVPPIEIVYAFYIQP